MPAWPADDKAPYQPSSTPASPDLGIVADTFWRQPGVVRSKHVNAFAAVGPHADDVNVDVFPLPPHIPESPIGRVHDLDGQVLLLGVGHDANTTLHLAEVIANVPYRIPRTCMCTRTAILSKSTTPRTTTAASDSAWPMNRSRPRPTSQKAQLVTLTLD